MSPEADVQVVPAAGTSPWEWQEKQLEELRLVWKDEPGFADWQGGMGGARLAQRYSRVAQNNLETWLPCSGVQQAP